MLKLWNFWNFWRFFGIKEKKAEATDNPSKKPEDNLVDERENKALGFIVFIAILGILGILIYVYQDWIGALAQKKTSYAYSMCATLFFVAGGVFCLGSSMGFLFGIPRSASNSDAKPNKHYIGNDNLLQISDWLTKIIIGVGLTELYQIPRTLKKVAHYIAESTHVANEALLMFVIIYFGCIGFLFGYLWTRLYFIKMLSDSDNDIDNDNDHTLEVKPIEVKPVEVKPIEITVNDDKKEGEKPK